MDFEDYLKRSQQNTLMTNSPKVYQKPKRQKADKGASLSDFIKMVGYILELVMPEVDYIADEGKILALDAMTSMDRPFITYQVISRTTNLELKPRHRESIETKDENHKSKFADIWGQKFKCIVQFNIFASVYSQAEEVMENFEEAIFKHTGFFKKNGVAELIFKEHLTDSHFDTLRESISIRNLRYYVEIEKLIVAFEDKIKEIEIIAQRKKDEEEK